MSYVLQDSRGLITKTYPIHSNKSGLSIPVTIRTMTKYHYVSHTNFDSQMLRKAAPKMIDAAPDPRVFECSG